MAGPVALFQWLQVCISAYILIDSIKNTLSKTFLYNDSNATRFEVVGIALLQVLDLVEFALEILFKDAQVVDLLYHREVVCVAHDLVESQHLQPLLRLGFGQAKIAHESSGKAELLSVRITFPLHLRFRWIVAHIYQ